MKLGDVTLRKMREICDSQKKCDYCPFHRIVCGEELYYLPSEYSEELLNRDISDK